jgi:FAD/FMN-containing dehydrogenase
VAGFTLGGGFGWLTRSEGYTTDRLTGATIVTADGEIRTIDGQTEPELFWAIRGGGGNFGVVTEFVFAPLRLGPEIVGGMVLWPIDQAPAVIDLFRRESAAAPDELMHVLVLRIAPPAPFLPEEIHGKPVVGIAAMYAGPVEAGMKALEPITSFGTPLASSANRSPIASIRRSSMPGSRSDGGTTGNRSISTISPMAWSKHCSNTAPAFAPGFRRSWSPIWAELANAMLPGTRQPATATASFW